MNETFKPALPKAPFIVGDVLLVLTAILIANSGEGPLDPLSFFWVIVCVGLGAVLACLPYIVEFRTVVATWNTFQDDQDVQLNTIEKSISKLTEQRKLFKEQADRNERIAGLMESMVKRLESRLQVLEEEEQAREKSLQEWQEALTEKLAEDREDLQVLLKTWGSEWATEIRKNPSRIEADETVSGQDPEVYEAMHDPEFESSDEVETTNLNDESDASDEEPLNNGIGEGGLEPNEETEVEEEKKEDEVGAVESEPGHSVDEPRQPELLEDLPDSRLKARKAGKQMSTLVAQLLIGIGNKPYVRGTGPGLSEEVGVPMEFLEIGKWQWVAPESSEAIICQVYKNDETPAEGESIVIEPGQRKVVAPRFS